MVHATILGMKQLPILEPLTQQVLESICLCAMFFVLLRMKLVWWKIILLGLIFAALTYLIELLPLVEGEPTIILIVLQSLLLSYVDKTYSYVKILFAAVSGTAILSLINALFNLGSIQVLHIGLDIAGSNALRLLLNATQVVAEFLVLLIIYYCMHYQDQKKAASSPLAPDHLQTVTVHR